MDDLRDALHLRDLTIARRGPRFRLFLSPTQALTRGWNIVVHDVIAYGDEERHVRVTDDQTVGTSTEATEKATEALDQISTEMSKLWRDVHESFQEVEERIYALIETVREGVRETPSLTPELFK